jgi:hypothetical protein
MVLHLSLYTILKNYDYDNSNSLAKCVFTQMH